MIYMGLNLSFERLFPELQQVHSILNMKPPSNIRYKQRFWFLGLATYCGKFITNFAAITEPLR